MNKVEFIKLIKDYQNYDNLLDSACDIFPGIIESKLFMYPAEWFENIIELCFTEEGVDWIYWWLFERNNNSEMKAYDENHNEIQMDTVEDLWNFIKNYIK